MFISQANDHRKSSIEFVIYLQHLFPTAVDGHSVEAVLARRPFIKPGGDGQRPTFSSEVIAL